MKTVLVLDGTGHDPQRLRQLLADNGYAVCALREKNDSGEEEPPFSMQKNGAVRENMSVGTFRSSLEGKLLSVNSAVARMFGYASPEEMMAEVNQTGIAEAIYARPERRGELLDQILDRRDWTFFEEVFRCRDGRLISCLFYLRTLRGPDDSPCGFEGFVEDISARRAAEKALQLTQFTIDKTIDQAFWMTKDHRFFYVNDAACNSLGYTREELVQMSLSDIDPVISVDELDAGWRTIKEKGAAVLETWHRTKEGRIYPVEVRANYVEFDGQEYNCAFATDISERKKCEEQVKASLLEKEVLLREIHHRVKNNLQVVSSLLYLQSQKLSDPELKSHFLESQSRICSMALAHEQLYQSENLSRIRLRAYVENLVDQLQQVFQAPGNRIDCRTDIGDIVLDIAQVVPCGLLITELLSNAYRHAFPDGRKGTITVSMGERDDQVTLTVADDGVGLPADLDERQSGTLGLQLVKALVNQLNGTVAVERENGTLFRVSFAR